MSSLTNEKCQLPRRKNNDNCVDKDANKFLLHQSKVWYILNDRINYIFDLQVSYPQWGLNFLKNIIPLMSLSILPLDKTEKLAVMNLSREIFELNAIGHEPSWKLLNSSHLGSDSSLLITNARWILFQQHPKLLDLLGRSAK